METPVHGRFLVHRPEGEGPFPLLVGTHGYGDTAAAHLEALLAIPGVPGSWCVVSVQALHPFYRRRTGEVVASWMTKLDRELAIADNVTYLGRVLERARAELPLVATLVYAGFSQGTAMAYRAAVNRGEECAGVLALGGDVPPELAPRSWARVRRVLLGRGRRDDWYTEAKLRADRRLLEARGVEVDVCRFEGGHEWGAPFREAAARFLARATT